MNVRVYTQFYATLAIIAFLITLAEILSSLLDRGDKLGIRKNLEPYSLEIMTLVATVSMLGSLHLSEGLGFKPCTLCWVQRSLMYPAAILLLIEVISSSIGSKKFFIKRINDKAKNKPYLAFIASGLAFIGLFVATFHRYEQETGATTTYCDPTNPCSTKLIEEYGFITIPTMAFAGFLTIFSFGIVLFKRYKSNKVDS